MCVTMIRLLYLMNVLNIWDHMTSVYSVPPPFLTTLSCTTMAANPSRRNSSSDARKKLEDQLTCTICFKLYSEPKILQCFHVFCMECIELLLAKRKKSQQEECALSCPMCRQLTPIPAKGAAGLQSAFHIYHLFDIHEDLMEAERERSASHGSRREYVARSHNGHRGRSASYSAKRGSLILPQVSCPEHKLRKVEVLCETCDKLICTECSYNQEHHDHERKILKEAAEERKKELIDSIKPVEDYCTVLTGAIKEVAKTSDEIKICQNEVENEIDTTFGLIIDYVKARKIALVEELKHISERKRNVLAVQKDGMEVLLEKVNNCIQFIHGSVQIPNEEDIFQLKKEAMKKIGDLTNQFLPQSSLVPSEEAKIKFSGRLDEIEDIIVKNFGEVYSFDVCPEKCSSNGLGLTFGTAGEKSSFIVKAATSRGDLCKEEIHSIECEVVSEITDSTIFGNIEKRTENLISLYEISYVPLVKGRHQLHVKIEGEHIKRSPFTVSVNSPFESIGAPISTIKDLKCPLAVALTGDGKVVVAEEKEPYISIFHPSGDKSGSFKIEGSEAVAPRGVIVDKFANIFVLDAGLYRLLKYSKDGQLLATLNLQDDVALQLNFPIGLAIDPKSSNLFVADFKKHRIYTINSDLTVSGHFGEKGSGKGQLWYPSSVACDNIGNIYVADKGNHRIQVFSPDGQFLKKFGREGNRKGQLKSPSGVCVANSYVYVAEQDNHRISVFTRNGQILHCFGDEELFLQPQGLAVDQSEVVYVCDSEKNCLQLF